MPFQNNVLAGASAQGGYQIANSLRFRASNSAYLSRSFGSPTSNIKWTWSGWIKRGALGSQQIFCGGDGSSNNFFAVTYTASDTIQISQIASGAYNVQMATTAVFRDPSAWYHLVVIYDSANATSTDRIQIYVNNSRQTVSYSTGPFGASTACQWNVSSRTHYLRRLDYVALYGDMYAANETFIDGQALTPSSFGQTEATTGVWVPKAYSGTYGNNGFFLQFKDAASTTTIGYDTSGNSNNFTTSGISVTSGVTFDQMLDTPTNNYAVWSPIDRGDTGLDVTNGNLGYTISNAVSGFCRASFSASTGKWYWELTAGANWTASPQHGISPVSAVNTGDATSGGGYGFESAATSRLFANGAATGNYGSQINSGDVLMIAVDFDAGKIWYGRNGSWFGSPAGDPAAGTNQSQTISTGVTYAPMFGRDSSNATTTNYVNFGQRPFAYTPPTGFKALNTANLSVPSIKKPSLYMDATLRTGTGATASVSSLGFQPDLVWIKSRSAATDHGLYDAVRGVQNQLESNTTTDETAEATGLTAFNSNGYTVGALAQLNTNAATYVDWAWKEGATPGFDIVTYTGNGAARTISHTLGAIPKFMIVKARSTASTDQGWAVYHASNTAAPETDYLLLNSTAATADLDTVWNDTAPTASVFSVGTNALVNTNNDTYVAYLWSEIAGFSRISSYTGNGSTDGPFVWCGFRPAFVMIKRGDSAENWSIQDDARNPFNVVDARLKPNSADAEGIGSAQNVDFLANGFKIRNTDTEKNASGGTYVFAAFAEASFKYARAR